MVIAASFIFFLLSFTVIGLLSSRYAKGNSLDYLLAGHSVPTWLSSLSAVATQNSGYMFIGMIGYTYATGLPSIWLMFGWVIGDMLASFAIYDKLRLISETREAHSFGGILAQWFGGNRIHLRRLAGLISVIFLTTYAAAQLSAGSKALHVMFGWGNAAGAIIGAVTVLLYSYAGGIRASIWTDAAQSVVMIVAMAMLFFLSVGQLGGWSEFHAKLASVSPTYLNLFPAEISGKFWSIFLFIFGWLGGGYGVAGQPHVLVRVMAMKDVKKMNYFRLYYYAWFTSFYALTIGAGLAARVLLPQSADFDPELALPTLATLTMSDLFVGLVLAAVFAATMSTADSLILSIAASLTRDFTPRPTKSYFITKLGTLSVTTVALVLALSGSKSVFKLVLDSWSVLGASLGPLLTVLALGGRPNQLLSILMVTSGFAGIYIFKAWTGGAVYEIAPAIVLSFLVYGIGTLANMKTAKD